MEYNITFILVIGTYKVANTRKQCHRLNHWHETIGEL